MRESLLSIELASHKLSVPFGPIRDGLGHELSVEIVLEPIANGNDLCFVPHACGAKRFVE